MRQGFTTGSCAAAAAKAAAYMLLTGKRKEQIEIMTPKGILYRPQIVDIVRSERQVSCGVVKDGGDDPDVTTGAVVCARVSIREIVAGEELCGDFGSRSEAGGPQGKEGGPQDRERLPQNRECLPQIFIDGGIGVGRVTRPGLDQPVGNAAINHVPRQMIADEVLEVCRLTDYHGGLDVEIYVPDGEMLAGQTFNPRLGIVGGISILGTTGIVEPMSSRALLETIQVELKQRRAEGYTYVAVSPGNYGLDFMKKTYGYDLDRSVKCSNYIGDTIDMAVELGYEKLLLTGHIGKLIKVAGGIMNTHSREADCRMELLTAFAIREGVDAGTAAGILSALTTEEALQLLERTGKLKEIMAYAMERIVFYLNKRAKGKLKIDCIMYATEYGELAKSEEADGWFTLLEQEQAQQI